MRARDVPQYDLKVQSPIPQIKEGRKEGKKERKKQGRGEILVGTIVCICCRGLCLMSPESSCGYR